MTIKSTNKFLLTLVILVIFGTGVYLGINADKINFSEVIAEDLQLDDQEATIRAINRVIPAVVSIQVFDQEEILTIDLDTQQQYIEKEKKEMGNGTGFLISSNGYILTNKHVVSAAEEETGEYKVVLHTGKEYYAQLIGKDPMKDLAILKIFDKDLPHVEVGDSNQLSVGSTVIAIGNSMGQYKNSATKGIVSGLGRYIVASNDGREQTLDNVIQTDAEINIGNSGGPLINLYGEVVGVNVAVDQGGTAIGFAIPMIDAEPVIRTIGEVGRIVRPYIGVYYMTLTPVIAEKNNLARENGAWLSADGGDMSVIIPDSPAEKAGLLIGDIIFEVNAIKVDDKNTLLSIVQKYKPGDKIGLKIQRGEKVIIKIVELAEFKQ